MAEWNHGASHGHLGYHWCRWYLAKRKWSLMRNDLYFQLVYHFSFSPSWPATLTSEPSQPFVQELLQLQLLAPRTNLLSGVCNGNRYIMFVQLQWGWWFGQSRVMLTNSNKDSNDWNDKISPLQQNPQRKSQLVLPWDKYLRIIDTCHELCSSISSSDQWSPFIKSDHLCRMRWGTWLPF